MQGCSSHILAGCPTCVHGMTGRAQHTGNLIMTNCELVATSAWPKVLAWLLWFCSGWYAFDRVYMTKCPLKRSRTPQMHPGAQATPRRAHRKCEGRTWQEMCAQHRTQSP